MKTSKKLVILIGFVGLMLFFHNNHVQAQDFDSNDDLRATCSVNYISTPVGRRVTWKVRVVGGGKGYSYDWSGTDGLSGSKSSASITYTTPGTKTANVVVTSKDGEVVADCPDSVEITPKQTTGYCNVQVLPLRRGGYQIRWGSFLYKADRHTIFDWSGTENLEASQDNDKQRFVRQTYVTEGLKDGFVDITSDSDTTTLHCSALVDQSTLVDPETTADSDDKPLGGKCYPLVSNMKVTWRAFSLGGNRSDEKVYTWSGDDGLSGSGKKVVQEYTDEGVKGADLTIESGDQSLTLHCEAKVAPKAVVIRG